MATSNSEKIIFTEIQKKLYYMIPEKWDAIYLYASIVEEPFQKPFGEMYFYYLPKGLLKRKAINVYEIPGLFNIDEESYNEIIQGLYSDIRKLRDIHREIKTELWTNITISIENNQFKIEYGYEDLGKNAEFNPYERHIIWRYKYLKDKDEFRTKEENKIIQRYLDSDLILFERTNNELYVEGIYKQQVTNIIDYERTMTVEAALAGAKEENLVQKEKKKKDKKNKDKSKEVEVPKTQKEEVNQIINPGNPDLADKIQKMKNLEEKLHESTKGLAKRNKEKTEEPKKEDIEIPDGDDFILSSDFMTSKKDK